MNIDNLARFVEALAQVVGKHPTVDMMSTNEPVCGTPGCHAGLAYLALRQMGEYTEPFGRYRYPLWADRLAEFLLGSGKKYYDLREWADENALCWGNMNGMAMFCCGSAFEQARDVFPSHIIRDHWRGVLARCRAEATKEL